MLTIKKVCAASDFGGLGGGAKRTVSPELTADSNQILIRHF